MLRLEVNQPTYERVGLVGKPIPSGGLKHKKGRFRKFFEKSTDWQHD